MPTPTASPTVIVTSNTTPWEILSSVLSAAAFLVAIAALYAASLKRADLRLALVPGTTFRTGGHSMSDYRFSGLGLYADLSGYNSGARGTILTGVTAEIADKVSPLAIDRLDFKGEVLPPAAFEAGDVRPIPVYVGLLIVTEGASDRDKLVALIEGVEKLNRALTIAFRYSYVKGYSFRPDRFGQAFVAGHVLRETADLSDYANAFKRRLDELDGLRGE